MTQDRHLLRLKLLIKGQVIAGITLELHMLSLQCDWGGYPFIVWYLISSEIQLAGRRISRL